MEREAKIAEEEITPKMLRAGLEVAWPAQSEPPDIIKLQVAEIYRRMVAAKTA